MLWSDEEIESFLEIKSRQLIGPSRRAFWHDNFVLYWDLYDSLILLNGLRGEEIVGWAQEWVRRERVSFADAFRGVLADLDTRRRKAWGLL